MGKGKHHHKARKHHQPSSGAATERKVAAPSTAPAPAAPDRPGQRFYDLPYGAPAPRLINPSLGLHSLVARVGHNAAYEIDVTLLDAPDHRLIRSGVLLAHRVLDGRGEWFLTAPDWQPLLPKDRTELMGHADLPEELADMIRPFRRRATLGPVAALNCDRREFALKDETGTTRALLRDDRVTVRRGGLITARYRDVLLTPVGPGLTEEQAGYLDRALVQAGGTHVTRLPRLVTRLGAPATGPTDIPLPVQLDPDVSLRRFVGQVVARRLRHIIEADLRVRGGDVSAIAQLVEEASLLQIELTGMSALLDPDWVEDLYDELGWVTVDLRGDPETSLERQSARLRSERYLTVLERLVGAARSPKLLDAQPRTAGDGLRSLLAATAFRLRRAADRVSEDSPVEVWLEVQQEIARLAGVAAVVNLLLPDDAARVSEALTPLHALLDRVLGDFAVEADALLQAGELTPEKAFAAGREFERESRRSRKHRREFLAGWVRARKRLPA